MRPSFLALFLITSSPLFADASASLHHISEPTSPRNIQVLLQKDVTEALLEVKGPYTLFDPRTGDKIASGLLGKRFLVRSLDTGLKWGEEFVGIYQFYIQPKEAATTILVNGIEYPGSVAVFGVGNRIHIVNDLDIELFVKASLAQSFHAPLEYEVMSSLAIVARTNAYFAATKASDSFWHLTAAEAGYQGSALVVPDSLLDKAVDSTRHLILVHPDHGQSVPFAATWTENSAGKTASYNSLFRKEAFAPAGVEAPHAALFRQDSKWTYTLSKRAFAHAIGVPQVDAVELFVDAPSSKVYALRIKDREEAHDVEFLALQKALGEKHIRSSDFTVSLKDDQVQFTGYGKGPGVGLCLYSASQLAQNGENAVKILAKFFPDTYLMNLDALPSE
jgi:stage II sporulation protein D